MNLPLLPAPELDAIEWINTPAPLTLASLRGRVVLLHAFQMLCPGCVMHGLPQAVRVQQNFDKSDLVVVGLHSVFEHHEIMTPAALRAFVQEYRFSFPIAIDRPLPGMSIPATMRALQLQGTPSTVLLDRDGNVRLHHLGQIDDMRLGAAIGRLLERPALAVTAPPSSGGAYGCDDGSCRP